MVEYSLLICQFLHIYAAFLAFSNFFCLFVHCLLFYTLSFQNCLDSIHGKALAAMVGLTPLHGYIFMMYTLAMLVSYQKRQKCDYATNQKD